MPFFPTGLDRFTEQSHSHPNKSLELSQAPAQTTFSTPLTTTSTHHIQALTTSSLNITHRSRLAAMSVTGFSIQHDAEMASFRELERAVLASEARRKEEQRQRRLKMGLPDVEGNRSILQRLLRKTKGHNGTSGPCISVEKPGDSEMADEEKAMNIHEFLQARPSEMMA